MLGQKEHTKLPGDWLSKTTEVAIFESWTITRSGVHTGEKGTWRLNTKCKGLKRLGFQKFLCLKPSNFEQIIYSLGHAKEFVLH